MGDSAESTIGSRPDFACVISGHTEFRLQFLRSRPPLLPFPERGSFRSGLRQTTDSLWCHAENYDSSSHKLEHRSRAHFAVGKIHYNPSSPSEDGTIIYLKPALVEGDSNDVLAYAKKNHSFPHDTTANQWFDEAHFENYRALGRATGAAASEEIATEIQCALK